MTFYDELKALCKKYDCHAAVYAKSKDEEGISKHQVFCITGTDTPTKDDIGMTMESIMYFVHALLYASNNRFYATHYILDLISTVIKGYKDDEKDES